jgi:CelD/BcsL family acetyltransferase involved in cellulose biosynthesis
MVEKESDFCRKASFIKPSGTQNDSCLSGKTTVEVEVYNSFDQVEPMQSEWDEFVESLGCEVSLTYDWCRLWWKYYGYGCKLRIFVFRCHGTLTGIIPVFFEKIWFFPVFIRAVKIVGTDFTLSTVTPPMRKEFAQEIVKKLFDILSRDYRWDVLHLGPISGIFADFENLFRLCQKCLTRICKVVKNSKTVQTYFTLANCWEEQIASLPKKKQRDLRRKYRLLYETIANEDAHIVLQFASTADFQLIFDEFVRMHQNHWEGLGKPGHFGAFPNSEVFHRELAQEQLKHGRLRLLKVRADSHILGYKYAYKFGDRYLEFLDARSDTRELAQASPGEIVFCEQMKKAIGEKVRCIDSMRGKYEYKLQMGGKLFPINNIFVYSGTLWPLIRMRIFCGLSWMLHMCYYNIWWRRIAPKLPFRRRALWKIWLRSNMFA